MPAGTCLSDAGSVNDQSHHSILQCQYLFLLVDQRSGEENDVS